MKKLCALALCLALCVGLLPSAAWAAGPEVKAKAVLLMEKSTGDILYEEHGEEPLELASVTKVMTMLLIMEALEDGTLTPDTMVAVSANAAGMGGSQVYMKEGETFSVHDMLKAIAVASGNDACVAMAEHLAGSEAAFVERMNARAAELGSDTPFFVRNSPQFCTGRGEIMSPFPLDLAGLTLVIVKPDEGVSTREAYAGVRPRVPSVPLAERLRRPVAEWQEIVTNDFEPHIFVAHPAISASKRNLLDAGALYASMSGSGSAVFGLFDRPEKAESLRSQTPFIFSL